MGILGVLVVGVMLPRTPDASHACRPPTVMTEEAWMAELAPDSVLLDPSVLEIPLEDSVTISAARSGVPSDKASPGLHQELREALVKEPN